LPRANPNEKERRPISFGPFQFFPSERLLEKGGLPIQIGARALDVLRCLVDRAGEVVSKQDLVAKVWAEVNVDEGALRVHVAGLRKALGDGKDGARYVANVPGRGYCLVAPVSRSDGSAPGQLTICSPPTQTSSEELAAPKLTWVDLAGADGRANAARLVDRPSIAVLPFQNMSGDPEQDHFADGMAEDIATGLSRIRWVFVVAHTSSFACKSKDMDPRQIGREFRVGYVLEGCVRKCGSRVRVTTQLLDAENGAHLWAEKFDGALEDTFELQDQIADRVVGVVEPRLLRSEIDRSRRKGTENLSAYDLYLRALPHVETQSPDQADTALSLLEHSLRLDPDFAAAHALAAWCGVQRFRKSDYDETERSTALRHARVAISSNTDDANALAIAGFVVALLSADHDVALGAIERALSLNPSCARAHYLGAMAYAFADHVETAKVLAQRALHLSPFDSLAFEAHLALGHVAIIEERYNDAAICFAKAVQTNASLSAAYFLQAIAMALAGLGEEARPCLDNGLNLEPNFHGQIFFKFGMSKAHAEKLSEGARLLGLPQKH
jgi:TolB-like protein/DNA-binding winged helix-turn-helix (wHTH) protein